MVRFLFGYLSRVADQLWKLYFTSSLSITCMTSFQMQHPNNLPAPEHELFVRQRLLRLP
jgi:hypothetical protein